MDKKQFGNLEGYYKEANRLRLEIKNIQSLVEGVRRRSKSGCKSFRVSVHRNKTNGSFGDPGIYTVIPEQVFRESILPALRKSLVELRKQYKELPSVEKRKKAKK